MNLSRHLIAMMMVSPISGFSPSHFSVSKVTSDTPTTTMLPMQQNEESITESTRPIMDRRSSFEQLFQSAVVTCMFPTMANAAVDCMTDCLKNCKLVAPKVSPLILPPYRAILYKLFVRHRTVDNFFVHLTFFSYYICQYFTGSSIL